MTRRRTTILAVALLGALLALPGGQASARKLGNSGTSTSFTATVTSGTLKIDSKDPFTFDDEDPITFAGTVNNTTGAVSIPANGVHFPTLQASGRDVHINVTETVTGTLNPLTGSLVLNNLKVWIKVDDLGDCHIGSASSPIVVNPLTSASSGSVTGEAYDASDGTAKVVNGTFAVPGADGCSTFGISVNGQVNDAIGAPSPSGQNNAQFFLDFNPTLTKGVSASFTASQPTASPALNVNFDASASTRTCTPNPCSYRWDWENDGVVDQTTSTATVSHQYGSPGTKTVKLTVVDTDGDVDSTTRTFSVLHAPALALDKSHSGDFLAASNGTYTLAVSNSGAGATQGTTTVTDTLPSGLTFVSASGTGWTCGAVSQTITCTRTAAINAGTSAPNITVTVAVASSAPSSVTNTASVASPSVPPESNTANNSDSDPTNVGRIDMRILKSHDDDFATGTVETYHLDVSNLGTVATTQTTTVTDTLPGGITYQSSSAPAGWTCGAVGQTVTCTHAAGIAASQSDRIEVNVVAGATSVGTPPTGGVTNVASVATSPDTNAANDSSSDPTTVIATVDLTIDKSHSSTFRVGSSASYTIGVQNRGARTTSGTTSVHDTLPTGVVPSGASGTGWSCNVNGQDVDCTYGSALGANQSAELITIDVNVTAAAARPTVTNTATVSTPGTGDDADSNPGNNSDSDPTTITATDLTIDKSHVGGFPLGGQGTYTLSVRNDGTAPTVGTTTVNDTLPAELSYVSASGSGWSCNNVGQAVTCTRSGSISAGQTAPPISLVVDVADTNATETVNSASVSTADDVNLANDSDTDPTPLTAEDLELTKTHSSDFRVGTSRAYVLRTENVGSQPTSGTTTVTDTLPAGLSYVGATGSGWSCGAAGPAVTCTRAASIAAGAEAPAITLQVQVGPAAYPSVTNMAEVANSGDRNDANDTATDPTTVTGPDLALTKTHLGSIEVNDRASYVIDVENVGTAASTGPATVTDTLPAGLTYAGTPSNDWDCAASGQTVTCEHAGSIAAGDDAESLELRADVDPSAASEVTNSATVALAEDPVTPNNTDEDTAAAGRVDLTIEKSHTGSFPRGGSASYTLAVSNPGSVATRGTTHVTDTLPSGLSYESASGAGWSCSFSTGTVDCAHAGPIAGGGAAQPITLNVHVSPAAAPQVSNTASVSTPGDADSANDSDTDQATTEAVQDVSASIGAEVPPGGSFRVGDDASYDVVVRNAGEADVAGPLTATLNLADGLTYEDFSGDGWSCSATGGQEVVCTHAADLPVGTRSDLGIQAGVAKSAAPTATTTVQVNSPMDMAGPNNTDSETTQIRMIDLRIAMQHAGTFDVNAPSTFTINVENFGDAATMAPIRVLDALPAGLVFNSASGMNWSCSTSGQTVLCTRSLSLAAGAEADPLTITVTPQASAGSQQLTNQATVATKNDAEASNNSATDVVTIGAAPTTGKTGVQGKVCKKPKKGKKGKKKCKKKRG